LSKLSHFISNYHTLSKLSHFISRKVSVVHCKIFFFYLTQNIAAVNTKSKLTSSVHRQHVICMSYLFHYLILSLTCVYMSYLQDLSLLLLTCVSTVNVLRILYVFVSVACIFHLSCIVCLYLFIYCCKCCVVCITSI